MQMESSGKSYGTIEGDLLKDYSIIYFSTCRRYMLACINPRVDFERSNTLKSNFTTFEK